VIDPLVVIDEYGTDAFRFTLAMLAAQGRDIVLSEERIEGARNFANKIWNAAKLALSFLNDGGSTPPINRSSFLPDRWIRSRAQKVMSAVTDAIETYRFNEAAGELHRFIWHEFCDWYLELIKPNLYGKVQSFDNDATRSVLLKTVSDIVKLLHPIMPFITEEIYNRLPVREGESIMVAPYPRYHAGEIDEASEEAMDMIMGVVDVVRNIRGETGIGPNVKVEAVVRANGSQSLLEEYGYYVKELAKIDRLSFAGDSIPQQAAVGVYKGAEVFVPIRDLIDVSKELSRIGKELARLEEDGERLLSKLGNAAFKEKAPPDVIAKNEKQYSILLEKREKLIASRRVLENLSGE